MRLTLRFVVFGATASAAVDAAVPQSGAHFPVVYPESSTIQAAVEANGVYFESGQFQPQKEGKLSGRKRVLSALGVLVAVLSASALSFLLWKCFGRSRKDGDQVSRNRRLAEAPGVGDLSECDLDELSAEDLKEKAADMVKRSEEKLKGDKERLQEREKKVGDARAAHRRLVTALQHREDLTEESPAEAITAAESELEEAREALKMAVVGLGGNLEKFPRFKDQFLRGVWKWLETQQAECDDVAESMRTRRTHWREVSEDIDSLERKLAALARAKATARGADSEEVDEARDDVEYMVDELRSSLQEAMELDESEDSEASDDSSTYVATEDDSDYEPDVREAVVDLPIMTSDELDEMAASSLGEALTRLEVEAGELEEREKTLNLKELGKAYRRLKRLNKDLEDAERDGDEDKQKTAREAFDSQRDTVEPLLVRTLCGKQMPADDMLTVSGIFTDFVRGTLRTAEYNISSARNHHERRKKAWDRVRGMRESFKALKEKVAKLEARDRTSQEEAHLQSARKRLEESHAELHESLKLAMKKDGIPLEENDQYKPLSLEQYNSRRRGARRQPRGSGSDWCGSCIKPF